MFNSRVSKQIQARMVRFLTETCTIEREDDTYDESGSPTHTGSVLARNVACRLITIGRNNRSQTQEIGHQESMVDTYRLICPIGTVLDSDYKVTVNGLEYQVVAVLDGRTDAPGVQATIVRMR